MSEPKRINGLLTMKHDSPVPHIGEAKRYSITPRISKTGKEWNKVKSEGDGYGKLYEVVTVEKTDFVDSHGNVSFNVDLIELSGGQSSEGSGAGNAASANVAASPVAPAQTVHSTSTNPAVAGQAGPDLEAIALKFFASLGKADDLLKQFFDHKQVPYEFWMDKSILLACHFSNKINK